MEKEDIRYIIEKMCDDELSRLRKAPDTYNKGFVRTHELLYKRYIKKRSAHTLSAYVVYTTERMYRNPNLYKSAPGIRTGYGTAQIPTEVYTALYSYFHESLKKDSNKGDSSMSPPVYDKTKDIPPIDLTGFKKLLGDFHKFVNKRLFPDIDDDKYKSSKSLDNYFLIDKGYTSWSDTYILDKILSVYSPDIDKIYRLVRTRAMYRQVYDKINKMKKSGKDIYTGLNTYRLFSHTKDDCEKLMSILSENSHISELEKKYEKQLLIPLHNDDSGYTMYIAHQNYIMHIKDESTQKIDINKKYVYMFALTTPVISNGIYTPDIVKNNIKKEELSKYPLLSSADRHLINEYRKRSFGYDYDSIKDTYDKACASLKMSLMLSRPAISYDVKIPAGFDKLFRRYDLPKKAGYKKNTTYSLSGVINTHGNQTAIAVKKSKSEKKTYDKAIDTIRKKRQSASKLNERPITRYDTHDIKADALSERNISLCNDIQKYNSTGNTKLLSARLDELYQINHKLIYMSVNKLFKNQLIESGLDKNDLDVYGFLGLRTAALSFDSKKGYEFSTYACTVIEHEIMRAYKKASNETGRYYSASLDEKISKSDNDNGGITRGDTIIDPKDAENESQHIKEERNTSIQKLLSQMSDDERIVIENLYGFSGRPPLSETEIAINLGITTDECANIHKRALDIMRKELDDLI